jgi:hypothetical protein
MVEGRQPGAVFLFYVMGLLSHLALSVLAFSTLGIQKNIGMDLAFIQDQGNLLADVIAPWLATFPFAAAWGSKFSGGSMKSTQAAPYLRK